jgi:hypothetical protein
MKKIISALVITTVAMIGALPVMAQQTRAASTGGNSPHETTSKVIDGNRVTITYGRPYSIKPGTTEVRKIWGGLVPYDKPWRMGSDEATTLITQKPIVLGGTTVPAGVYTLYMVPSETGVSKLAISTGLGEWGIPVDTKHDLAQVDLTKTALDKPVDQFTMAIDKNPDGGGVLKLSWEGAQFSVPFTVPK